MYRNIKKANYFGNHEMGNYLKKHVRYTTFFRLKTKCNILSNINHKVL